MSTESFRPFMGVIYEKVRAKMNHGLSPMEAVSEVHALLKTIDPACDELAARRAIAATVQFIVHRTRRN